MMRRPPHFSTTKDRPIDLLVREISRFENCIGWCRSTELLRFEQAGCIRRKAVRAAHSNTGNNNVRTAELLLTSLCHSHLCVCPLFYILSLSSKRMKTRSLFVDPVHETPTPMRISPDCLQVVLYSSIPSPRPSQSPNSRSNTLLLTSPKHMFARSTRKPVMIVLPMDNAWVMAHPRFVCVFRI
jgi:hypothetical protein